MPQRTLVLLGLLVMVACYDWRALIPGPAEEGYDEDLAQVARRRERQFQVLHALPTGLNCEISIGVERQSERQAIENWLTQDEGWDFEAHSGMAVTDAVDGWWKVAGAYAGAGIAADAFRYGVLRDQCYPDEEVVRARAFILRDLEALHLASAITGLDGASGECP